MKAIRDKVYSFKTSSDLGFTSNELDVLLQEFPDLDKEKYGNALQGITCTANENGEMVIYHCDVYKALCCGTAKRNLKGFEWD